MHTLYRLVDTFNEVFNLSCGTVLTVSRQPARVSESLQVVGSKAYIRIYERQADGSYKPMPLDVAA